MVKLLFIMVACLVCLAARTQISSDSLVLLLPFNGNANDISGNGYNGVVNGATLTTGYNNQPNGAYYFDGITNCITIPNIAALDSSLGAFTILIRLQPAWPTNVSISQQPTLVFFYWDNVTADEGFSFSEGQLKMGWQLGDATFATQCALQEQSSFCTPTPTIYGGSFYTKNNSDVFGQWMDIAYVYNQGSVKIYQNCDLEYYGQNIFPPATAYCMQGPAEIVLGTTPQAARALTNWDNFTGKIDELRFYARALSEAEIKWFAADICNEVIVNTAISFAANPCQPNEIAFTDTSKLQNINISRRVWRISNGDTCTTKQFTYAFSQTGKYTVELDLYADSTVYTADTVINIASITTPRFLKAGEQNITACNGTNVALAVSGGKTYTWQPCGLLNNCNTATVVAQSTGTTTFTVTATNDNSCTDTLNFTVVKIPDENNIYAPTAFTPNGDGHNDTWGILSTIPLTNYSMQVFNRWGQPVFATQDQFAKWDGTRKGNPAGTGVYVWVAKYKNGEGCREQTTNGTITLIR